MQLVLIHNEAEYYAGAQRMLVQFVSGAAAAQQVTVFAVPETRIYAETAQYADVRPLPANQPFSAAKLLRQVSTIVNGIRPDGKTILHGWTARDWEVTAIAGRLSGNPTVGTLHDHPAADFISAGRQKLMRCVAHLGLDRIIVVSDAVRQACQQQRYPIGSLTVIRNGLAEVSFPGWKPATPSSRVLRLGFLGAFSERKGLDLLFELIVCMADSLSVDWELQLAGAPQNQAGAEIWNRLQNRYARAPWWPRIKHLGWVDNTMEFLARQDLLLFTSRAFDPLPTVLIEAGQCGTPVFAAAVGGVDEIVIPGISGWLFDPAAPRTAGQALVGLLSDIELLREAGRKAAEHIRADFSLRKMIEDYQHVYSTLLADGL